MSRGVFLILFVLILAPVLRSVPLAALAAILVHTGFKLASPKVIKHVYDQGIEQLVFFLGTLIITLYTDLLIGIIGNFYFSTFDAPEPNIVQKVLGVKIVGVEDYGAMFAGVENIYRYFIQTVATFSFAMLIGFLVRRGILAILIFYSAFIIEFIVGLILKSYDFEKLYEYLPLQSIGESLPIIDFTQLIRGITSPVSISMLNIGVVIFYIILFLFLIKKLFFKRDIS